MNLWVKRPWLIFFWNILAGLHFAVVLLLRLIPALKRRLPSVIQDRFQFEAQNNTDIQCRSFIFDQKKAQCCFQVASEGEWEQVRWVVERILQHGELVEVIFTSPSVNHRLVALGKKYSQQLRYLRTPLVSMKRVNLSHWMTSNILVMVRYDFFPMFLSMAGKKKMILLWFFRPRDRQEFFTKLKWKMILPLFDKIVASNRDDWWWLRELLPDKLLAPHPMDLRLLSIDERLDAKDQKLVETIPGITKLISSIEAFSIRIIHGNAYLEELVYLNDLKWKEAIKNKKVLLAIAAHHPEHFSKQALEEYYQIKFWEINPGMSVQQINDMCWQMKDEPGVLLFGGKGYLLELYPSFLVALVGGGFFGHTHSIWEPFMACSRVYCGAGVFRSSEYYQAKEISSQKIISLSTMYQWRTQVTDQIMDINYIPQSYSDKTLSVDALKKQLFDVFKEIGHELK